MEIAEVTIKESPGLCRCCLSEGCYKDLGSEYTWMNDTEIYADMLLDCFDIGITQHNDGPNGRKRLICEVCITRLRDACNFKRQVVDSERKFIDMLGRGEFRTEAKDTVYASVPVYETPLKAEAIEEVTLTEDYESNVEYLDDMDNTEDDEPVKSEPPPVPVPSTSTSAVAKRGRPKKADSGPPEKKAKLKPKVTKLPKDANPEKKITGNEKRRTLETLFNFTSVMPFKWRYKYICFICGLETESPIYLKEHTKSIHIPYSILDHGSNPAREHEDEIKIDVSETICNVCTKRVPSLEDLTIHLKKHEFDYNDLSILRLRPYRLVDLKCVVCDEIFSKFYNLNKHMILKHSDVSYDCQNCGQKFSSNTNLKYHLRAYHKKEYTCLICSLPFDTHWKLVAHRSMEHSSKCNVCFQKFTSNLKLRSHMMTEHNLESGGSCGFCNKRMPTKYDFLAHATQCVARPIEDEPKDKAPNNMERGLILQELRGNLALIFNTTTVIPFKFYHSKFSCFYCPKEIVTCIDLRQHMTIEHPVCDTSAWSMKLRGLSDGLKIKVDTSSLYCKKCSETFDDFPELVKHLEIKHKAGALSKKTLDVLQPYKLIHDKFGCPFCDEVFRYFALVLKHVSTSHSSGFICMHCAKTFRSNANLRSHLHRNHSNVEYKCSDCGLNFTNNNSLKTHMGSAHGKKVISCNQCSEMFVSWYQRNLHAMKIHDRGHKCSHCERTFVRYSTMAEHVRRSHLKEKNIQCTICNGKFFNKARLKAHMVKHVGERPFGCDLCQKKFIRKKNLRGHMEIHLKILKNS